MIDKFGIELYKYGLEYFKSNTYFSESYIIKLMSIYYLYSLVGDITHSSPYYTYSNTDNINKLNKNLGLARVDANIIGKEAEIDNHFEVKDIMGASLEYTYPSWFMTPAGKGLVINICRQESEFVLKACGSGEAILIFRGIDIRDKNNKPLPFTIDYLEINITRLKNNKDIFHSSNNYQITRDNFIKVPPFKIQDGEQLKIIVKFKPSSYNREDFDKIVDAYFPDYNIEALEKYLVDHI